MSKTYSEKAEALFKEGCNCSQAVVAAFADEINMDEETALKLASSFGGGLGRMREVCGAVSGLCMVAGLKYGYSDPGDYNAKKEHYALIRELSEKFKSETGSIVCRELLDGTGADSTPTPEARTETYYKKRPCAELVKLAAEITEEMIQNKDDSENI
nr:putative redox-active protein (C_GCAxxG_C_C) [uncultured bacterium]